MEAAVALAGVVVCAAHQLLSNAKQESICMKMAMEKMADTPRIFHIVSISADTGGSDYYGGPVS